MGLTHLEGHAGDIGLFFQQELGARDLAGLKACLLREFIQISCASQYEDAGPKLLPVMSYTGTEIERHYFDRLISCLLNPVIKTKNLRLSYTVSGNVNWCSHCGKQYGGAAKH